MLVQREARRQRNSRHFDDGLSCKCCGSEVLLVLVHLEIAGNPSEKFVMSALSVNVINDGSRGNNPLACQEVMIVSREPVVLRRQ